MNCFRNDPMREINDKFISCCAKCGREGLKRNMTALYMKRSSYHPMRIVCHLCPNCAVALMDELAVTIPE